MKYDILDVLLVSIMFFIIIGSMEGYVSHKDYANIKDGTTFLEKIDDRVPKIHDYDEDKEYHTYQKDQTEYKFTEVPEVKRRRLEDVSEDINVTWKYLYQHWMRLR